MKNFELLKICILSIVSIGTGTVVRNAIVATTPRDINPIGRVVTSVGAISLTGLITYEVTKYVSREIDKALEERGFN